MMRRLTTIGVAMVMLFVAVAPARADATAFLGANLSPANRQVRGLSVGIGLLILGFEFEYANTTDDPSAHAPSLTTGMGNILLQTPGSFLGVQPYVTAGGGIYRETLDLHQDTSVGINTGGGVKIDLVGPLRLRVDYRFFRLGNGALNPSAHRVYAGLNLKF
jgi:opacity protein-like surface antigen